MSNLAVLNFNQLKEFDRTGLVPEYRVDGQQVPAYAFEGAKPKFGAAYEWKLFPQDVTKDDLGYLYERCGIATNAVDAIPDRVWGKGFTIKVVNEQGDEVQDSQLEKDIWAINQDFRVRKRFQEAHAKARLYGMSIIMYGVADGLQVEDEVEKPDTLTYLRVYDAKQISEMEYDKDQNSETYGQITRYKITLGGNITPFWIHASRVIHLGDKTWGNSVLTPAYNSFVVFMNGVWSAGEAYYQNASPLFVLSWDDAEAVESPTDAELDDMQEDLENLHVKKRFIKPASFVLDTVKGSGVILDPAKLFDPLLEIMAGELRIPKQILLGTEAGAIASGEVNMQMWYDNIADEQRTYAEPLLIAFYQQLQAWGILDEGDFDVEWTPLWEISERERAELNKIKMETAVLALGDAFRNIPPLMSVEEAREQILGLNPQIGAGRLPTLKTEASEDAAHLTKLPVSTEQLYMELHALVAKVKAGIAPPDVLAVGNDLIHRYSVAAREEGRAKIERVVGHAVPDLTPEQRANFEAEEVKLLKDFERMLDDVVKQE